MMKKVLKRVGGEQSLAPGVKESLEKCIPDSNVVMGRAHRGLFSGLHIWFGNSVCEDGRNNADQGGTGSRMCSRGDCSVTPWTPHIHVKVTTHTLRCIDKAGGIDEYLLNTPYQKMDMELGLYWKTKIEKTSDELGKTEVALFSPKDKAMFEEGFKQLKLDERSARREFRRRMYGTSKKDEGQGDEWATKDDEAPRVGDRSSPHSDDNELLVAYS